MHVTEIWEYLCIYPPPIIIIYVAIICIFLLSINHLLIYQSFIYVSSVYHLSTYQPVTYLMSITYRLVIYLSIYILTYHQKKQLKMFKKLPPWRRSRLVIFHYGSHKANWFYKLSLIALAKCNSIENTKVWLWDGYGVSICRIFSANTYSHVFQLPDLVLGSHYLPLAPCMTDGFGRVTSAASTLGQSLGICPLLISSEHGVSKSPLLHGGYRRTSLALKGSRHGL